MVETTRGREIKNKEKLVGLIVKMKFIASSGKGAGWGETPPPHCLNGEEGKEYLTLTYALRTSLLQ